MSLRAADILIATIDWRSKAISKDVRGDRDGMTCR